jgi:hypothetical protein
VAAAPSDKPRRPNPAIASLLRNPRVVGALLTLALTAVLLVIFVL